MVIESIELKNFRNYPELNIQLDSGTNIFYGDNAQGKTNLLEAVFMACTSRSFRMSRDREIIRFGMDEAHIKLRFVKRGVPQRIDVHLKKRGTKGIAIDEVPLRRASDLLGVCYVISFSPEDLSLVKEGPSLRRRFMDTELCQLDKIYLHDLSLYSRALDQRNRLLKDAAYDYRLLDTLPEWNNALFTYGVSVIKRRREFLQDLSPIISRLYSELSGGREELEISYEASASEYNFMEVLDKGREQELKMRTTLYGPHRDDISFSIDGRDIRKYGSQGQKRSAALALKLSEIEIVREQVKDSPVLLLDDVLSELDSKRQNDLLKMLSDTQSIITCTGLDEFVQNGFHIDRIFHIENGAVLP